MTAKRFICITDQLFDSIDWGFALAEDPEDDTLIRWGIAFREAKAIAEAHERGQVYHSDSHGNTALTMAVGRVNQSLKGELR